MTAGVVMPFSATLVIPDRGTYAIARFQGTWGPNGINAAEVIVNTGTGENQGQQIVNLQRGDEAYVLIENAEVIVSGYVDIFSSLVKRDFKLFTGVVDDFGPTELAPGIFALQIKLFGRLVWLNSGTMNSTAIRPNQYTDMRVQLASQFGAYFSKFQLDPAKTLNGLGDQLKSVFNESAISTESPAGSITEDLKEYFNIPGNTIVSTTIQSMVGDLLWRDIKNAEGDIITGDIVNSVCLRLNEALLNDWFMESYLNKIQNIGAQLKFSVVENSDTIKMVPYTPFFRSTDAYPILPQTYSAAQWIRNGYTNYQGVALLSGPGSQSGQNSLIVGKYKRIGKSMGIIHVAEAPSVLLRENPAGQHADGPDPGTDPRISIGDIGNLGDRYAKVMAWELNYSSRALRVTCPMLRTDIGPLTAVRVDFPNTPDIGFATGTPAMYGSVQSVTIYLDATQGKAQTSFDVGYVRSYQQQTREIDPDITGGEHPFFKTSTIGCRLDSNVERPISNPGGGGGTLAGVGLFNPGSGTLNAGFGNVGTVN
jgi:hypothetical protein